MIVKFLYLIAILVPRSIQSVVDVEGGRAGDGERQVGEAGDCVHPGGPVRPGVRLLLLLQERPGDFPDGWNQSDAVTQHDDDHDVDAHFGDQNLALPN